MKIISRSMIGLLWACQTWAVVIEQSPEELIESAAAICRGTVLQNRGFEKDPYAAIYTETGIEVLEVFKGFFADTVRLEHRGGEFNGRGESHCGQQRFNRDDEILLFIQLRADGTLYCLKQVTPSAPDYDATLAMLRLLAEEPKNSGVDLTQHIFASDEPSTRAIGVLPGATGYTSRFLNGDRNEPIEYLVDMDALPSGITPGQALSAVSNAFSIWSTVTSLSFKFAGIESFGMAAADVNISDGRIRVQLHDLYGYISDPATLGRGGRSYSYNTAQWPSGGTGARIGNIEFDLTTRGFVVMKHTQSLLANLTTFEEVVCHEIGHVISLGHSSETENETNPALEGALMYYLAHADGRGAALAAWDTTTVQTIYPTGNTPPYGYNRTIHALHSPGLQAPLSSGINQVELNAYDLQGGAVPVLQWATSNNGTFSFVNGTTLLYTPLGWFGQVDTVELGPGGYWDTYVVRLSDGINLSAPVQIRVVQMLADGNRNWLADSWATDYGISGGASDDQDHDGFTNLDEWFLGSNPTDPLSNFKLEISPAGLSWSANAGDLFEVQSATALSNGFASDGNPVLGNACSIDSGRTKFYRVQRLK